MMAVTLVAYVVILFTVAFGMAKKLLCDCKPTNEWDGYAVAARIAFIKDEVVIHIYDMNIYHDMTSHIHYLCTYKSHANYNEDILVMCNKDHMNIWLENLNCHVILQLANTTSYTVQHYNMHAYLLKNYTYFLT